MGDDVIDLLLTEVVLDKLGARSISAEEAEQLLRKDPNAKVRIVLSIEGEDASRLQRISAARGEKPTDVIADLLREADRPAAQRC